MNSENDKYFCEKYPKIFVDRRSDLRQTAMCWGFECGNGWLTLIDELCRTLQWNTDKNGYPQVVAVQVKEKFVGLRFYYTEKGCEDNKWLAHKSGRIEGAVSFAETMSYKICEICGSTKDVTTTDGWNMTRCSECLVERSKNEK